MVQPSFRAEDYKVGWVCALPLELAAAVQMLDEEHQDLPQGASDQNLYVLGRIGKHNVVITCSPAGQTGTNSAATVVSSMASKFRRLRFGLMVGIGGGVPSAESDIRLGDVVVSQPSMRSGGVVQYDSGKAEPGRFIQKGILNSPPTILLSALLKLQSLHHTHGSGISVDLSKISSRFAFPEAESDLLFEPTYDHVGGRTCYQCDRARTVERIPRENNEAVVHYGTIASGNLVVTKGTERDRLSSQLGGVLCFEMEAAGLMGSFPCLVIRGICDYADSHKNKRWQAYAAVTAAACAKELLSVIPGAEVAEVDIMNEHIPQIQREKNYSSILEKIEDGHQSNAAAIFRWVTSARRPLSLAELGFAILRPSINQSTSKTEEIIRDELQYCGGLCTIRDGLVYLVHESVREYLCNEPGSGLEMYHINKEDAEVEIADLCFALLQSNLPSDVPKANRMPTSLQPLTTPPLLDYAILFWPEHGRQLHRHNALTLDISAPFYSEISPARAAWYRLHQACLSSRGMLSLGFPSALSSTFSAMHLAAYTGMEALGAALLSRDASFASLQDDQGRDPLAYAAYYGHDSMVRLLGATVCKVVRSQNGNTALHFAVEGGSRTVVELLLGLGADAKVLNNVGETPLHIAARKGNLEVARILLNSGSAVDSPNFQRDAPLDEAYQTGGLVLDNEGKSALQLAIDNRNQEVARLIADHTGQELPDILEASAPQELYNPHAKIRSLLDDLDKSDAAAVALDIEVQWGLLKFVNKLTEQYDLDQVLTLSGYSDQAVAKTCQDYVTTIWPETGRDTLTVLRSVLSLSRAGASQPARLAWTGAWSLDITLYPEDLESGRAEKAFVHAGGTKRQVVQIAQQIAWFATVFRSAREGQLSYSMIHFQKSTDKPTLLTMMLSPLKSEDPGQVADPESQCWHLLFNSSVISYGFPVPERNGERGLEIPFDIMTTLARVDPFMKLSSSVVLEGTSFFIFPTDCIGGSVQWHVLPRQIYDDLESVPHIKVPDQFQQLRCFLGFCQKAEVLVGTSLFNGTEPEPSGANDESSQFILKDDAITASANLTIKAGPVTGGVGGSGTVQREPGQKIDNDDGVGETDGLIKHAMDNPMIVYDFSLRQGWLIPELCVALWLAHAFIRNRLEVYTEVKGEVLERTKPIHAELAGNGGRAALDAITRGQGEELWTEPGDENPVHFIDVIRYILKCFKKRRSVTQSGIKFDPKSQSLRGWEAWDIVHEIGVHAQCHRKEILPIVGTSKKIFLTVGTSLKKIEGPMWWSIGRAPGIAVLFSKRLGQLIRPATGQATCNSWQVVPANKDFLAASIPCILQLRKTASSSDQHRFKLTNTTGWNSTLNDFCTCDSDECNFVQEVVEEKKLQLNFYCDTLEGRYGLGAMVFGDPKKFTPKQCWPITASYPEPLEATDISTSKSSNSPPCNSTTIGATSTTLNPSQNADINTSAPQEEEKINGTTVPSSLPTSSSESMSEKRRIFMRHQFFIRSFPEHGSEITWEIWKLHFPRYEEDLRKYPDNDWVSFFDWYIDQKEFEKIL